MGTFLQRMYPDGRSRSLGSMLLIQLKTASYQGGFTLTTEPHDRPEKL